jgi:hypothetical protein
MPKNRRYGWRPDRILGMGNSDTVGEDGPGTGSPLRPEQFVKAMDVLASYVAGRGLPLLMTGHYRWMMRYLAVYFEHSDTPVSFTSGLPFLGKEVSFGPDPGRVTRPAVLLALPGSQVWDCYRFLRRVGPKRAARAPVAFRAGR